MASMDRDYVFTTQPDDNLKCVICLEIAREAKQHEDCGKLFCRECIEKNGSKPCPNCRAENPHYFRDMRSQRDIRDLPVRCDNVERGCDCIVTVGTLDGHVTKCEYSLVCCPNKCDKKLLLMRKELDDHLNTNCPGRDYECGHCGERGTYASIMDEHYPKCQKMIVPCPNPCCPLRAEHGKISDHVKTVCKYTVVACKYEDVGCSVKMIRKDIKKHENGDYEAHFRLALNKIAELKILGSFSSLKKDVSSHDEQLKTLKGQAMTFKLSSYNKKKERCEVYFSEPFYTNPGGYKMSIEVYPNGDGISSGPNVSIYLNLLKGLYDDKLQWPFIGTVKFELLNQLANDNHRSLEVRFDAERNTLPGDFWGFRQFIDHSKLFHDFASNTQYLMEDTLYFRVSVTVDNHKPWLDCTH